MKWICKIWGQTSNFKLWFLLTIQVVMDSLGLYDRSSQGLCLGRHIWMLL